MNASVKLPVYPPSTVCGPCGGKCCKRSPGASGPSDWAPDGGKPDFDAIAEALRGGRWLVDWWMGDPRPGMNETDRAYFLRPAVVGYEGRVLAEDDCSIVFSTLGQAGVCTFLTDDGCEADRKPAECSALRPTPEAEGCRQAPPTGYATVKQVLAEKWLPYSQRLFDVALDVQAEKDTL